MNKTRITFTFDELIEIRNSIDVNIYSITCDIRDLYNDINSCFNHDYYKSLKEDVKNLEEEKANLRRIRNMINRHINLLRKEVK